MRELAPCGTCAAYARHLRRGEEPCEACKCANSEYQKKRYATRPEHRAGIRRRNTARDRALSRLAKAYPDIFRALYDEELGGGA